MPWAGFGNDANVAAAPNDCLLKLQQIVGPLLKTCPDDLRLAGIGKITPCIAIEGWCSLLCEGMI